jgi:hypothetical protein
MSALPIVSVPPYKQVDMYTPQHHVGGWYVVGGGIGHGGDAGGTFALNAGAVVGNEGGSWRLGGVLRAGRCS